MELLKQRILRDGQVVACGTPEQICNDPASITGRYLRR